MKMRLMSMALVVLMLAGLMTGCTNGSTPSSVAPPASVNPATPTSGSEEKPLEHATLVVSYPTFAPEPADLAKVEAAINKLTEAELNVTIKLQPHAISAYGEQIKLQMIAQEQVDVLITGNMAIFDLYTNQVNNGQLLPLDDLLTKYGQDLLKVMGPTYAKASAVNGKVYGMPQNRDLAQSRSFIMDAALADKNGIDPKKITNYAELEAAFAIIKKNEPGVY
ncbi:MAG: extracellular solute-binding protein, partial [Acinetobacter sp.]